ncbi:ABC-three component system protein [Agrobacterium burrii]|uniref:ABC-three component systems C-terminal domain-containing protein n=1 Tax=Agrobacterium burrii TaxID=2815339 RepID=A0ABS3EP71_9HYPH|nr:ABC-three component system protein [Agrobacterium burrii]MBO0133769.1 hypothetical protein [Agrobacterium burrii]
MNLAPIVKLVRAYDATEWEIFISEWQKGLSGYASVKRLGGSGDQGRDVIGLYSSAGCQGEWDNYQCKHYEVPLSTPKACEDAGKIIFHAFQGAFTPPRKCSFVAPRGPSTELRDLLLRPNKFKAEVIATWNKRVAGNVVANEKHLLAGALEVYVEAYDFTTFTYATIDEILDDHRKTAYWASRFNGVLPPAPAGVTPAEIAAKESVYVTKLLDVYSEETGTQISCAADLNAQAAWKADLQKQRVRFYDAEAFMAHYRDQTEPGTIEDFAEQIHDAIEPVLDAETEAHPRLTVALATAGQAQPASVLAPRAKVRVKQGVCHQLANEDRVSWKL